MRYEPKERGQKNILIMGKQAETIELSTDLGINYMPCCSIVLMCYNAKAKSRFNGYLLTVKERFNANYFKKRYEKGNKMFYRKHG